MDEVHSLIEKHKKFKKDNICHRVIIVCQTNEKKNIDEVEIYT
jgi:hypothetical protein